MIAGMFRRLFTLLSALSLLLCVVSSALWIRSYSTRTVVTFWTSKGRSQLAWERGTAWVDNDPQQQFEREVPRRVQHKSNELFHEARQMTEDRWKAEENGSKSKDELKKMAQDHDFKIVRSLRLQSLSRRMAQQPMTSPFRAAAPLWPIAASFGILPMVWTMRLSLSLLARKKRLRGSLCPVCGYDVRATPDRCPECGAVPARTPCQSA
jgi:hypothetical protein